MQFMIGLLFFYAGATGLSQLIGLKDHKRIVMPLGLITLVLSGVVFPDAVYQANWVNLVWLPYITTVSYTHLINHISYRMLEQP